MAEEKSSMAMNNDEQGISVPSHLFVELTSLAELSFPTTASSRIKYTCVCASPHILAVGSSSGTVYLFSRYAAKNRKSLCNVPVQVIPCQEGAITLVEISPDEKSVAVATSRGFICVLNISRNHSAMILSSVLHVGSEITCFCFSQNGSRLFSGDSLGRVSCSKLASKLSLRSPCDLILRLDSRVVQIDHSHSQLLVSTLSRCYLHNTARQTTTQIGSKIRNGLYGACFFTGDSTRDSDDQSVSTDYSMAIDNCSPLIFCARPGGRLWEVDSQGKVYSTHQFGSIRSVWSVAGFREFTIAEIDDASNITFGTVNVISEFIMSAGGRTLTLVDPKRGKLVLIADVGEDFAQFCICANDVFLLTADGYLRKVTLFTLEKAIEKLQFRERFNAAAQVVCAVYDIDKMYRFRLEALRNILSCLEGMPEAAALLQKMDSIIAEAASRVVDNSNMARGPQVAKLASGIHKVIKGMENSGYEDDFTFRMPSHRRRERSKSRSPYHSLTRRSKSVSSVKSVSASDNGEAFVDVPLDGELANVAQEITLAYGNGDDSDQNGSNYRTVVDGSMNISRSEESLTAWMDEGYEYENRNDVDPRLIRRHFQRNESSSGDVGRQNVGPLPPVAAGLRRPRRSEILVENSSSVDDPLSINPAALKETLKTGGKFLIDAVQKLSLLSMGPDFGDPMFLIDEKNGLYENDEEVAMDDDGTETERTIGSDATFAQFIPEADLDYGAPEPTRDKPLAEAPVVQRVLRTGAGGRVRVKRTKISGKTNGVVMRDGRIVNVAMDISEMNFISQAKPDEKTEITKGTVATSLLRNLSCDFCGLHNAWRFVLTVGPLVEKLDIAVDCYKDGGIPVSQESWRDVMSRCKLMRSAFTEPSGLCSECGQLWTSWFSRHGTNKIDLTVSRRDDMAETVESVVAAVPDATLVSVFGHSAKRQPRDSSEALASGSAATGDTAFGVSSESIATIVSIDGDPTAAREDNADMTVSMYYNPLYESMYNGNLDSDGTWRWLSMVPLDVLVSVGVKVIGLDAAVDILLQMAADHEDIFSDALCRFISCANVPVSMNTKVLNAIARDVFSLSCFCSDVTEAKAIRIDVREFCPCCTLPLTSVVAESDQRIFIFECGHSYHKICLLSHARHPYSCLVCTMVPL